MELAGVPPALCTDPSTLLWQVKDQSPAEVQATVIAAEAVTAPPLSSPSSTCRITVELSGNAALFQSEDKLDYKYTLQHVTVVDQQNLKFSVTGSIDRRRDLVVQSPPESIKSLEQVSPAGTYGLNWRTNLLISDAKDRVRVGQPAPAQIKANDCPDIKFDPPKVLASTRGVLDASLTAWFGQPKNALEIIPSPERKCAITLSIQVPLTGGNVALSRDVPITLSSPLVTPKKPDREKEDRVIFQIIR